MAISLSIPRPKLVGTVTTSADVIAKPLVENPTNFQIPFCYDGLTNTPIALSDISIISGSPTVTGLSAELANVKLGSVIVTDDGTDDFTAGTYVTAKPTPTTLTVSTNALASKANTTGTATLTVDATAFILRITPVASETNATIRFNLTASIQDGSKALDSNGNGYDEVTYADGREVSLGSVSADFDAFATAFGLNRVNS